MCGRGIAGPSPQATFVAMHRVYDSMLERVSIHLEAVIRNVVPDWSVPAQLARDDDGRSCVRRRTNGRNDCRGGDLAHRHMDSRGSSRSDGHSRICGGTRELIVPRPNRVRVNQRHIVRSDPICPQRAYYRTRGDGSPASLSPSLGSAHPMMPAHPLVTFLTEHCA